MSDSNRTRPEEPISLLEDEDCENNDASTVCSGTKNSMIPGSGGKRSAETLSSSPCSCVAEDSDGAIAEKKTKLLETATAIAEKEDGCMLGPKNPIKIFATDRDKTARRRLRRSLRKNDHNNNNNNKKASDEDEYRNHWSVSHCWTFREMLGLDRFSFLRGQPNFFAPLSSSNENENSNSDTKSITKIGSGPASIPTRSTVGIDWIFIATYILDVDYLLKELPELLGVPIVVIVYQYKDDSFREASWIAGATRRGWFVEFLPRNPRAEPRTATNPLSARMDYGCHHTKMTLVGYSSGRLRVHVHTSNLRREDVHDKCQGAFIQDFLPKTEDQLSSFATSAFEESLVTYVESYRFVVPLLWNPKRTDDDDEANGPTTLVSHLQTYDFSTAVAVLVPSVPGYHKIIRAIAMKDRRGEAEEVYGYLKVRQAIRDNCKSSNRNNSLNCGDPIVCQFSSMGALSKAYLNKIARAWNADAATATTAGTNAPTRTKNTAKDEPVSCPLKIVWPTTEEIITSVEGRMGGGSVPGRSKNLRKEFIRPMLHKWKSLGNSSSNNDVYDAENDPLEKGKHVPHIKSYYQICNDDGNVNGKSDKKADSMRWFVLSSHNLSKAAWGEIQTRRDRGNREVLTIQHWELGVFLSPSTLGVDSMGPLPCAPESSTKANSNSGKRSTTKHDDHNRAIIPLPYKFRPDKYQISDEPWVVE